jgi:hypothetical protein
MQPTMSVAEVTAIVEAQRRQKENLEDQIVALSNISIEIENMADDRTTEEATGAGGGLPRAISQFSSAWAASLRENLVGLKFQLANNEAVLQAMSSNILVPGMGQLRRKQPS